MYRMKVLCSLLVHCEKFVTSFFIYLVHFMALTVRKSDKSKDSFALSIWSIIYRRKNSGSNDSSNSGKILTSYVFQCNNVLFRLASRIAESVLEKCIYTVDRRANSNLPKTMRAIIVMALRGSLIVSGAPIHSRMSGP
jgi:hypothetical protein